MDDDGSVKKVCCGQPLLHSKEQSATTYTHTHTQVYGASRNEIGSGDCNKEMYDYSSAAVVERSLLCTLTKLKYVKCKGKMQPKAIMKKH